MKVAVINGPNMNLIGIRETEYYGTMSWNDIENKLLKISRELGIDIEFFQSNHEGEIVDFIQKNLGSIQGIVLNPAGLSKTGYSILDAMCSVGIPYIEVHMSNIFKRGGWHAQSIFSENAIGQVIGLKDSVYELGLRGMKEYLDRK